MAHKKYFNTEDVAILHNIWNEMRAEMQDRPWTLVESPNFIFFSGVSSPQKNWGMRGCCIIFSRKKKRKARKVFTDYEYLNAAWLCGNIIHILYIFSNIAASQRRVSHHDHKKLAPLCSSRFGQGFVSTRHFSKWKG